MSLRFETSLCVVILMAGCGPSEQISPSLADEPLDSIATSNTKHTDDTQLTDIGTRATGVDWPTFLGPERNGHSPEQGILTPWPEGGPRIVWQKTIGEGYGIGSVSRGRFFQFDRYGDQARLSCLHAETGETMWDFEYPTKYEDLYQYNGGPRSSPIIDRNRVYVFGVEGMLHCLRASDGEVIWRCNTSQRFGVIQNFFGVGSTPVIEGDLLIAVIGGSPPEDQDVPPRALDRVSGNGSGIVAFNKYSGEVKYRISDQLAGYASPVVTTIDQRRWCFAFCRGGLLAFDPAQGAIDFFYPWRAKKLESVNAGTPVVVGREIFISEAYSLGSTLLEVRNGGYQVVWRDDPRRRQKSMQLHWNTPVHIDGYLYGCSGQNSPDTQLRCVEWKTGKVEWSVSVRAHVSLLSVDGYLIGMEEQGTLLLIKPSPKSCEIVSYVSLRDQAGRFLKYPCWAAPVLSHGLLYVRSKDRLLCLELIPEGS